MILIVGYIGLMSFFGSKLTFKQLMSFKNVVKNTLKYMKIVNRSNRKKYNFATSTLQFKDIRI